MLEPNSILQKRYRIIKPLAQGGMGAVYEAIDQRVKSTVVLKRTLFDRPDLLQAFEREARLLANLRHPALPKVMDHFVEGTGQYLVMEHIPGQDLAQMLKAIGRPFAPAEVLRWADELLRVLEYLHRHNPPILHRDIKPSNLKLTESGEIYLLDFGLAKGAAGQMSTVGQGFRSIPGYTPSYAPLEQILRSDSQMPERHWVEVLSQIKADEVDAMLAAPTDERSDIYALGTTLYHLLTNEQPTHAGRRAMYVWKDLADPARPVSELNPLVPPEVAGIIESAMELSPERRPPSASAMRAALRDAAQSLRLHTGQSALRQLPPEVFDAIVRRVAEEVSRAHEAELDDLRAKLEETRTMLAVVRNDAHRSEEKLAAINAELVALSNDPEELKERVESLRSEVVSNYKHLDLKIANGRENATTAIQDLKARLHVAVTKLERRLEQVAADAARSDGDGSAAAAREGPKPAAPSPPSVEAARDYPPTQTAREDRPPQSAPPQAAEYPAELSEEEKRQHNEARRFARLLVSEIIRYDESKVREGREAGDLYRRLRDDIDRSRQLYDRRIHPKVAASHDYFHQELVDALAEGDPHRMGDGYPGEVLKKASRRPTPTA